MELEVALIAAGAMILSVSVVNLILGALPGLRSKEGLRSALEAAEFGTALFAIVIGVLSVITEENKTGIWIPLLAGTVGGLVAFWAAVKVGSRSKPQAVDHHPEPHLPPDDRTASNEKEPTEHGLRSTLATALFVIAVVIARRFPQDVGSRR